MYLEKIDGPADIKKLNINELNVLADETRHYLIEKVSNHGTSEWWKRLWLCTMCSTPQ